MGTIEVRVGAFVKEHLPNIIKYLDDDPEHINDLMDVEYSKKTFCLTSNNYPFMSNEKDVFKYLNNSYRCWSTSYKSKTSEEYYFCSQWGSTEHGEKRGNAFKKYLKDKKILLEEYKGKKIKFIIGNAEGTSSDADKNTSILGKEVLNQILYGPPGTGKTYSTVNKALDILLGENHNSDINSIGKLKEKFGSQVEFVTFHQSFSYEDFVEGLKAKIDDGELSYEVENGVFKQICENAENSGNNSLEQFNKAIEELKDQLEASSLKLKTLVHNKSFDLTYNGGKAFYAKPNNSKKDLPVSIKPIMEVYKNPNLKRAEKGAHFKSYILPVINYLQDNFNLSNYKETSNKKPHVLIIDEINRGNISRIFGELITLIEPSKRAGESEVISVKLPYSKEDFSVPNNLYIIGTMNTADRSLTMMDTALRRRFDFIEMAPDVGLVKGDFDGIKVGEILDFINQRIEILYDREHLIGHSFLMNIRDLSGLKNAFKNKILPLLEEYFYDDFENIRKVLNDKEGKFYQKIEVDESLFFGNENIQKDSYKKANIDELTAEDFQQIYKNQDE